MRREVVGTIPGAVLALIPQAGHLLPLEATEALAEAIRAFVQGLDRRS